MVLGTEVRPRPEGGGIFAPALGGGSGANRIASDPVASVATGVSLGARYFCDEGAKS
ncbi:hypothetical protein DT23_12125 [Thioclava indica]|uniref:Uncharacterized protein n=1 Tax=Thioclava indica TaxID=1353528 RepID=A0A074JWF6_9RHOB|nr:hypothetical protein DT23_12125 [Thioclava indica]